jgi:tRNA pseudouridine13 synthase
VSKTHDSGAGAGLWIRTVPEDFRVEEQPLYAPTGEGRHLFLLVEKRDCTTEQVARALARASNTHPRDVGYAGRKDRHAVTRQWFSLEDVEPERALDFVLEGARVLEAKRHPHKLRTGHLRANRFEIVLRGDSPVDLAPIQSRADSLVLRGLPNRFGEQRFGRDGDNAERARAMLAGGPGPRDRRAARFLVSALQSELFNAVLSAREDAHDEVVEGDVARVEESGGLFWVEDLAREQARARAFEISATGPIFGRKMRRPRGEAAAIEEAVQAELGIPPSDALHLPRGVRASGTRRALRVRPEDLAVQTLDEGHGLRVSCSLPPGSYVTVLVEALVGRVSDASRERPSDAGDAESRVF